MLLNDILKIDLDKIDYSNPKEVKTIISHMINLLETAFKEISTLKEENQKQKDEINRLKGEKVKPQIKPNVISQKDNPDKKEKHRQRGKKQTKLDKIKIDDTKIIKYEGKLPPDAKQKGYRDLIVQDIVLKTNNILYKLERYYSPDKGKTYEASLPEDIKNGYGANLHSWILFWYYHSRMSEQRIHKMLKDIGILISEGEISNIIIKDKEDFHLEKKDIIKAGLKSTPYQHIDDTGARENGRNKHFVVLCNDYYSAFFTIPKKNRLSIIDILNCEGESQCLINEYTLVFLEERKLKLVTIDALKRFYSSELLSKDEFMKKLDLIPELTKREKQLILEASVLTAYQESNSSAKIKRLVCDDAKQFHDITELRALCWIHEERLYVKLLPLFDYHKKLVNDFRSKIWEYYNELKKYKENPNEEDKKRLSLLFDEIFSTKTGYDELDERIKLTKAKKENLLVVLDYPDTPLHNNPAELALRMYVIKRKISSGTRTPEGTKSWETFFTILDTCRKLGVNFRDYLYDRISKRYKMEALASLIPRASP